MFFEFQVRDRVLALVPLFIHLLPGNVCRGAPRPVHPHNQTALQHRQPQQWSGRGQLGSHGRGEAIHRDSELVNETAAGQPKNAVFQGPSGRLIHTSAGGCCIKIGLPRRPIRKLKTYSLTEKRYSEKTYFYTAAPAVKVGNGDWCSRLKSDDSMYKSPTGVDLSQDLSRVDP